MAGGLGQLARDTAIYGVSSIVGRFLNWLLVPVYTRVFSGTGEFGIYTHLYAWTALLLVVLTYGMETALFRYLNKPGGDPSRVYTTTLKSVGATSLFFLALAFAFLTPLTRVMEYGEHPEFVGMMLCVVATDAFCCIPFAHLRHQKRAGRFALLRLLNIFLNIALNLFFLVVCPRLFARDPSLVDWFYVPGYGVGYVFVANVITTAVTFLLLLPDILPALRRPADFALLGKMLRYAFPILLLGVAGIANQTADKILFPFLFEDRAAADEQLGIYGACFRIAVVMVMFIQAFRYAYEPFIFARNRAGGGDEGQAAAEAMKYFIIFSLVIFLAVMFYLDILKYFVAPAYYPGLRVVPLVMLGEVFFGICFNLSFWYKLSGQTRWGAYFSLAGCAVTFPVIILFSPAFGYQACAWASLLSNMLMMVISYCVGQRKYPIRYDLKSAFVYFAAATALYAAGMCPVIEPVVWRLLYRTALLAVWIVFIVKRDLPLSAWPYVGRFFK